MKDHCRIKGMFRHMILFVFLIAFLYACASNQYLTPVSTFRDKTQQTVGTLSDFYSSRNLYEIDLYLQGVAVNSEMEVLKSDKDGAPTPLGKPYFMESSIKARLETLRLVNVYASRLYDLANTTAPTEFKTSATALGQNLSSLDKTFQKLQGVSDPTASKYIGPISSLIGIIGEMYLNYERNKIIEKAIKEGPPQVDIILSQIRDDMNNIFLPQVITGTNQSLAILMNSYNDERKKLSYEQREKRLSNIKATMLSASAATNSAPSDLIVAMMNAHKALVQFANDSKDAKPASFAALNGALNEWANQIENLTTQVKLLVK